MSLAVGDLQQDLECPVCFEQFEAERIVMCIKGHSLCDGCVKNLPRGRCPFCDEGFKGARNYALDGVIRKINTIQQPPLRPTKDEVKKINHSASVAPKEDVFKCRITGCTTRLPIKSLIKHLHDRHAGYLEEFKVYRRPWMIKERIVFRPSGNQCMYTLGDGGELFALRFQPHRQFEDGKRPMYCWVQAVCSNRSAKDFSYRLRLISQTTEQYAAEYSDYMHGECSYSEDIREDLTCFFAWLPKYEENVTFDLEIYDTMPGPLGPRRDVTEIYEQRYE